MTKKFGITTAVILPSLFGFFTPLHPIVAATLYVNASADCAVADGTTTKPFCSIQEGVDATASGDTVRVAAGTYREDVSIVDKGLKILGENPENTFIVGFSSPFYMKEFTSPAKYVEIANFTISGAADYGVAFDSSNLTGWVHNCILVGNKLGIGAWQANAIVTNNVISGSADYAVYTNNNGTLTLYSNILMNNNYGAYANEGSYCGNTSRINSAYNHYFENTTNRDRNHCASISTISDSDDSDPKIVDPNSDYHLQPGSPCVDAGSPAVVDKDPDGTRSDQGVYGGPGSAAFRPNTAGLPVVTNLLSSPANVVQGGTFTITANGSAQ